MSKVFDQKAKQDYFRQLRYDWKEAKELSVKDEYKAAYEEAKAMGVTCSITGFVFTKLQMEKLGLLGIPYLDTKTYKGWSDLGFRVKKGEKSKISGVTFLVIEEEDKNKPETIYPKKYALFHISQVEKINK